MCSRGNSIFNLSRADRSNAILSRDAWQWGDSYKVNLFSSYKVVVGLRCGGDFKDPTPRDADGSVRTAVTAIDALDGRRGRHFPSQWKMNNILRELNKAYAGCSGEHGKRRFQEPEREIGYVFSFLFLSSNKYSSHSYLPGMWCVLGKHCIEMLLTMDRNECCGSETYVLLSYNEKAFASEFQSFLRQVVGSYSEKLSDHKRGLFQSPRYWQENATLTTGKLLRTVCRCALSLKTRLMSMTWT